MLFYVIAEGVIAFLLVAGGIFAFTGSLGMLQFKDFFMRLHGPTKGTTLGIGCMLIASMLYFIHSFPTRRSSDDRKSVV